MHQPFSRRQANLIVRDFEHLVGASIEGQPDFYHPIECIAIAPWDEINKWIFLQFYMDSRDAKEAITHYKNNFFDVILIARFKDKDWVTYRDLRSYCLHNGMTFNLSKYGTPLPPVNMPYSRRY
jgi:hypothetical protein